MILIFVCNCVPHFTYLSFYGSALLLIIFFILLLLNFCLQQCTPLHVPFFFNGFAVLLLSIFYIAFQNALKYDSVWNDFVFWVLLSLCLSMYKKLYSCDSDYIFLFFAQEIIVCITISFTTFFLSKNCIELIDL